MLQYALLPWLLNVPSWLLSWASVLSLFHRGCSQSTQQNMTFLHWRHCGVVREVKVVTCSWNAYADRGLISQRDEPCPPPGTSANSWLSPLCLTPPQSLFSDCLDSSAVSPHFPDIVQVPWLILPISLFGVSADFRHVCSQLSQWYLWLVLEKLQGADKWEWQLSASMCNTQKRFSTSVDGVSVCSGSFVPVTFSQLNENPLQRLMQPEATWEVQTHLLSSLGALPTILQAWQDENKGSKTWLVL